MAENHIICQTRPSDVPIVVLSSLGKGKTFPSDEQFLLEKFCELSEKFPVLFRDFIFTKVGDKLVCGEVDIAMNRIKKQGLVEIEWKTLGGGYLILPSLVEKGKTLMEPFHAADRIQLNNAAKEFKKMVNHYYDKNKKCDCVECKCG